MKTRISHGRLFGGVAAVVVAVAVAVGAFASGMLPLSGHATVEDALGLGRIAFVSDRDGDDEIYVMNADGSGLEQLTDNGSMDRDPAWSPDGGRIVFASERENEEEVYDIYLMNADGSGVEQLTDGCSNYAPAWSPDGDRIAFASRGNIYVMNADGSGVELLMGTPSESCAQVFVSDRDGEAALYKRNADGSVEPVEFYDLDWAFWYRNSVYAGPEWSPDGSRIALRSRRDGELGVYVMNADGSGLEELGANEVSLVVGDVGWSPDGGRVAFGAELGYHDDAEIYVVNADGSGVAPLTDNDQEDFLPAWSPDGSRIAFTSDSDGVLDGLTGLYVMNADGSGVVRLTDGHSPAWSQLVE